MTAAAEPAPQPISSGAEYIESLRGRHLAVYLFGERVAEPVDHPVIRPSVNAMAATYDAGAEDVDLATAESALTGSRVNRFLHVAGSAADLVAQGKMQRRLGQVTGTCFQRCVGMDAINSLFSITFDVDAAHGTGYHPRFLTWVAEMQHLNLVIGGAMTDVKGDRSKGPAGQADPDLFVHVVRRGEGGLYISGAKAHQTGAVNSHWLLVMPGQRLAEAERDYAIACGVPVTAPGLTFVYGRQSCDSRSLEGDLDVGNAGFAGQEALVIFDEVFVPDEHVFLDGQFEFAGDLVERFTAYHRRSYVCKAGVGDVLIGAAALVAEHNGVANASHIRDKLVEMTHLNETIYGTGIAASYQSTPMKSGVYLSDDMLSNVCKHHVTKLPYEIGRLAQDLAGGLMVTMPSEQEFNSPEVGELIRKYLKGRAEIPVEDRMRILRLIENMTMGRNAVGYLTESMHGAGSPQAQRIQISRAMQVEFKKSLAKNLAGIAPESVEEPGEDASQYMVRVFKPVTPPDSTA